MYNPFYDVPHKIFKDWDSRPKHSLPAIWTHNIPKELQIPYGFNVLGSEFEKGKGKEKKRKLQTKIQKTKSSSRQCQTYDGRLTLMQEIETFNVFFFAF